LDSDLPLNSGSLSPISSRLWIIQGNATNAVNRLRAKELALAKMRNLDALVVTVGMRGKVFNSWWEIGSQRGGLEDGIRG